MARTTVCSALQQGSSGFLRPSHGLFSEAKIRHHAANGQRADREDTMSRKAHSGRVRVTRRTVAAGLGATIAAGMAPFNIVRAQGAALKVGVLLPKSGYQAGIGQDCQRGVDIANGILKDLGLPPLQIMNADTETN